jgi:hypothetical protein
MKTYGAVVAHELIGLWIRPYCAESTASHPNSEVKLRQAALVLGWATTRESAVPYPFVRTAGH